MAWPSPRSRAASSTKRGPTCSRCWPRRPTTSPTTWRRSTGHHQQPPGRRPTAGRAPARVVPEQLPAATDTGRPSDQAESPAEAEKVLDDLIKRRPDDPDVWYDVAEVRGLSGNTIGLHRARAEYFTLVGDFDQAIQQLDYAKRRAGSNFPLASQIDQRQRNHGTATDGQGDDGPLRPRGALRPRAMRVRRCRKASSALPG